MYDPQLEKLVDMALEDGVITEKEKDILVKRAKSLGIDLDEFEMYLDSRLASLSNTQNTTSNQNKFGNLLKCPSCGASVPSLSMTCKDCGFAFRNISANSSVKELSNKLEHVSRTVVNEKKGWKILCVTNANNITRVNELKNIAIYFDTALEVWNYQDSAFHYNMHPQIYKDIKNEIDKPNVKMILTHNPLGEYGHIQHIKVSNIVLTVSKKPTYVFSYSANHKSNQNEICNLKKYYKSQDKIFKSHCQKITKNKIYRLIR